MPKTEPNEANRHDRLAHATGTRTTDLARRPSSSPAAIAARRAWTRAEHRLDFLLTLRKVTLSAHCRPVLLAKSAREPRHQRALTSQAHLADGSSNGLRIDHLPAVSHWHRLQPKGC
jgi:hypothetical protein